MKTKLITKNKKAYFNYEILETLEAGISLLGMEVKSIKGGQINIGDSYIQINDGEAYLWNAQISKYRYSDAPSYDSLRKRKLLLKRKEIEYLENKSKASRLTIVPLSVYLKRGMVKIGIGLVKGKKKHEKKHKLKERQLERDLHRDKRRHGLT